MNNSIEKIPPSEVSIGVLIIPSLPIKTQIESASIAISKLFDNEKPIDNNPFPAHISLYLGGINNEFIPEMIRNLGSVVSPFIGLPVSANQLYTNTRGFLAVQCNVSNDHSTLIKSILKEFEKIQNRKATCRPHILEKWGNLSDKQKSDIIRSGTYKDMTEDQHISVAHVSRFEVDDALLIAKRHVTLPQEFTAASIVFADIGHRNEKWNILTEWK